MFSQDEFEFDEQAENLERVSSRIERAIIQFCSAHPRFHADDLRQFVAKETGIVAPGSADRILRDLRQRGQLNYKVLNRRGSLYQVTDVRGKE
jgi:hypothetical protein